MAPVWMLYNVSTSVGGPSLAEGCDSVLQLSCLGHGHLVTVATAANTAAFASLVALAGHFTIRKVTA